MRTRGNPYYPEPTSKISKSSPSHSRLQIHTEVDLLALRGALSLWLTWPLDGRTRSYLGSLAVNRHLFILAPPSLYVQSKALFSSRSRANDFKPKIQPFSARTVTWPKRQQRESQPDQPSSLGAEGRDRQVSYWVALLASKGDANVRLALVSRQGEDCAFRNCKRAKAIVPQSGGNIARERGEGIGG